MVEAISLPYGCLINNAGHGPLLLGNQILDISLTPSLRTRDLSNHLKPDIYALDNVWAVQPNDVNRKYFCVNGS